MKIFKLEKKQSNRLHWLGENNDKVCCSESESCMSHLSSRVIEWILQVNILSLFTPQSIKRRIKSWQVSLRNVRKTFSHFVNCLKWPGGWHDTPLAQGDGGVGQEARQPSRVLGEVARGVVVAVLHPAPIVWLETCNIGDGLITYWHHY